MKLRHEASYAAGPDAVYAALTDEQFLVRKSEAIEATDITASVERTAEGAAVQLRRTVELHLPGFAKKLTGSHVTLVDEQRWRPAEVDGSRVASVSGTLGGHSGGLTGTVAITPAGPDASTVVVEGEVKVSVPIVGGRIEKLITGLVRDMLDSDQRVLTAWLAER